MSAEPVPSRLYDEEYYRETCGGSEFYALYGPRVPKPQLAYALRKGALAAGLRVLDLGCGRGELLHHAAAAGAFAVGTDYAEAALKTAGGSGAVLRCDAKALPFKDGSFDRAFLLGVMDHLHEWELEACLDELRRVLKAGGFVVAQTCANRLHHKLWSYGLRRRLARWGGWKEPAAPRSDHDEELHVNEQSRGDLERLFTRLGWAAEVEAMPNYKALVAELYGPERPRDLPLRPYPAWRAVAAKTLARSPLGAFLAQEFFVVARPGRKS